MEARRQGLDLTLQLPLLFHQLLQAGFELTAVTLDENGEAAQGLLLLLHQL